MNASIRHHFVPQGFLRGFGTTEQSSFVWVYDKTPGYPTKKKSVRSIAWAPAYYATEREDGTVDSDMLEKALASNIDNDVPEIIRAIRAVPGRVVKLDESTRGLLAFFFGLSLTRVPSFRDGMNDLHSSIAQISLGHVLAANPELAAIDEKLGGIRATAKPWVSLDPMIKMAQQIAESALSKTWQFYVPPSGFSLATSDNPVIFSGGAAGLRMIGPAHPGAELVMNLRKDLAIVCTPKRGYPTQMTFALSTQEAKKFNRGIVRSARQRVFTDCYSETFEHFVKKYSGEEQRLLGQ